MAVAAVATGTRGLDAHPAVETPEFTSCAHTYGGVVTVCCLASEAVADKTKMIRVFALAEALSGLRYSRAEA